MRISCALLDVDGTLRHEDGWLDGALELLDALGAAGITVALCSGRAIESLRVTGEACPQVAYLAGGGGSVVEARDGDGWRLVGRRYLPREVVDDVAARTAAIGMELWAYTDDGWLVRERTPRVTHDESFTHTVSTVGDLTGRDDVAKLLTFADTPEQEALRDSIARLDDVAMASSYPGYWDVLPVASLASKGGDLVLSDAGLAWAETMAVGDGSNDLGMLSRAGLAYALAPRTLAELAEADDGQERHAGGVIADVLADLRRRGIVG